MSDWRTWKRRVAGKWQLPLLPLALLLLVAAIARHRAKTNDLSPEQAIAILDPLLAAADYDRAIDLARRLLSRQEPTDVDRAPVYLRLARAESAVAHRDSIFTPDAGRQVVEHYRLASQHGCELNGADLANLGAAWEWQAQFEEAVSYYQRACELGLPNNSDLRRHVLELLRDRLGMSSEDRNRSLDEFLAVVEPFRLDLRLWALEEKIYELEELGRLAEGPSLLAEHAAAFRESDLVHGFDYLESLLLFKSGAFDAAEIRLRTLRSAVPSDHELNARAGWLLGRLILQDDGPQRPEEANAFFLDVVERHPGSFYATASRVGMAEASAMLERHDDAISLYQHAIEDLARLPRQRLVDIHVLRTSLRVTADTQRQNRRFSEGLAYARLALSLVPPDADEVRAIHLQQVAQLQSLRADELDSAGERGAGWEGLAGAATAPAARALYAQAAESYLALSQLVVLHDRQCAESSWRAAELYVRAGMRARAAALYLEYAAERPTDSLVPRALLRVGQLFQSLGRLTEAIEAYQSCYRRFPLTLDGARTLIPLAECYLAQGPGQEELAEKTLRIVLEESDLFTPEAPEFADALFLLGETLNRRSDYARAIAVLEEIEQRYPLDPRVRRAQFLLADSYRLSGLALRKDAASSSSLGDLERAAGESDVRLRRARELYRSLIEEYERVGLHTLQAREQLYLRLSYLYRADCCFELGEHRAALKLYEEAAGAYSDTLLALSAYVQIIHCHVFLGEPGEARAALSRAKILADVIPAAAFDQSLSPEKRADWKRYLVWLGESGHF